MEIAGSIPDGIGILLNKEKSMQTELVNFAREISKSIEEVNAEVKRERDNRKQQMDLAESMTKEEKVELGKKWKEEIIIQKLKMERLFKLRSNTKTSLAKIFLDIMIIEHRLLRSSGDNSNNNNNNNTKRVGLKSSFDSILLGNNCFSSDAKSPEGEQRKHKKQAQESESGSSFKNHVYEILTAYGSHQPLHNKKTLSDVSDIKEEVSVLYELLNIITKTTCDNSSSNSKVVENESGQQLTSIYSYVEEKLETCLGLTPPLSEPPTLSDSSVLVAPSPIPSPPSPTHTCQLCSTGLPTRVIQDLAKHEMTCTCDKHNYPVCGNCFTRFCKSKWNAKLRSYIKEGGNPVCLIECPMCSGTICPFALVVREEDSSSSFAFDENGELICHSNKEKSACCSSTGPVGKSDDSQELSLVEILKTADVTTAPLLSTLEFSSFPNQTKESQVNVERSTIAGVVTADNISSTTVIPTPPFFNNNVQETPQPFINSQVYTGHNQNFNPPLPLGAQNPDFSFMPQNAYIDSQPTLQYPPVVQQQNTYDPNFMNSNNINNSGDMKAMLWMMVNQTQAQNQAILSLVKIIESKYAVNDNNKSTRKKQATTAMPPPPPPPHTNPSFIYPPTQHQFGFHPTTSTTIINDSVFTDDNNSLLLLGEEGNHNVHSSNNDSNLMDTVMTPQTGHQFSSLYEDHSPHDFNAIHNQHPATPSLILKNEIDPLRSTTNIKRTSDLNYLFRNSDIGRMVYGIANEDNNTGSEQFYHTNSGGVMESVEPKNSSSGSSEEDEDEEDGEGNEDEENNMEGTEGERKVLTGSYSNRNSNDTDPSIKRRKRKKQGPRKCKFCGIDGHYRKTCKNHGDKEHQQQPPQEQQQQEYAQQNSLHTQKRIKTEKVNSIRVYRENSIVKQQKRSELTTSYYPLQQQQDYIHAPF